MNELFEKQMKDLLKDEYVDFKEALSKPNKKAIYLNPLKKDVLHYLNQDYIKEHVVVKDGYYFDYENYPLGKSPFFLCGLYYIQEPSAMLVSHFLDIKEDDYVLDMCAAPGGKTCAIASRLSNNGLMIANDIVTLRAKILSENIERFGIQNTIVTNCDPVQFPKVLPEFFDKIVLDAPCSGEGMFRKSDAAIDTWSIDKVNECAYIQRNLIDAAMKLLKPSGQLIYSTCTYNTTENEQQVQYILDNYDCSLIPLNKSHGIQPGINMEEAVRLYPHKYHGEGHFIALIQKHGEAAPSKMKMMKASINKQNQQLVSDFYKTYLNIKTPPYLYDNNNHIYAILPQFPELKGIRVLRNGLYLGECKKNRFEPSLALALTLTKQDVKQSYSYSEDDQHIRDYIHGETIEGSNQKGYGVLFVEDYPLSFYKESNKQAKKSISKGLKTMKRYEKLKDIFYQNIEDKCHGIYKQKAYFHSLQVCTLCKQIALKENLDIELAAIIGLFHDYAQFINHSSFNHAHISADMIKPLLDEFNDEEINIIISSIKNHSDKDKIHDQYSEMIKDADVLAQYLEEPDMIFNPENQARLKKYLN